MKTISLRDANQGFARCVREVEAGEEFVITRNGAPVARLVPVQPATRKLRRSRKRRWPAFEHAWRRAGRSGGKIRPRGDLRPGDPA